MEKILIATRNKDKFNIVKKILNSLSDNNYKYFNLYDIKNINKNEQEKGNIEERAYNKAKQAYSAIKDNNFKYIIGIDDGIKIKGELKPNVKEYIKDILDDKYLVEGEIIEIVRAYCFMNQNGDCKNVITNIPFKYHKLNKKIELHKDSYPLSNVLTALNSSQPVADMDKEETNKYYLKYSREKIKEVF